ncbi:Rpn family recombination-promoting nuclease/putative transposase [Spirosoma montaniterrae]|uniref:Rpn family recombination-promoting nuclease/putative transposase n=1 Tax=Spirosoma montaniterrae TaxID=1178516 RepID=UPI001E4F999C
MSFIIVELAKFTKQVAEIETDLEKLVYTMKTLHTTKPTQYPAFWNEEWLRRAIDELDTRKMTPEERAYFARVTAANAEAVKAEKQKIREAVEQNEVAIKTEAVAKAIKRGKLTIEEIAEDSGVSVDFVLEIQRSLTSNS